MSSPSLRPADRPGWYEIRLAGHLAPRWNLRFDGMTLTRHPDGSTVVAGPVIDQAALHGLLHAVRDLGVPLLSVTRLDPAPTAPQHPTLHKETS